MTSSDPGETPSHAAKVAPETLELRARPQPVTRISRKVLIGAASVLMFVVASIVLVALRPPSFRGTAPQELYNVDHKPISDGLSRLPATYDGLRIEQAPELRGRGTDKDEHRSPIPLLTNAPALDPAAELERAERQRLARLAGQARDSALFFRVQLKSAPRNTVASDTRVEAPLPARTASADGDLATISTLKAAERARALAGGETDQLGIDVSDQARKLSFLKSGPEKEIYNPHGLQTPTSPYQLMAGAVIAASLITGLSSDLPGFVIAQVTENVFDTISGRFLLVPQGSRLIGRYDNVVAFGQERALVVWQRIILPDGASMVIDNLPATDTGGYAGLADEVDLHTWKLLKGVALATVLGIGSELAFNSGDSDLVRALRESTQSTTNRAGQRLVERNLNVQPTITVRPGWPLRVIVHKDLVLRPYLRTVAK